jgi:hypothetical protein
MSIYNLLIRPFFAVISILPGMVIAWVGVTIGVVEDCMAHIRRERVEYRQHYQHKLVQFRQNYLLQKAMRDELEKEDLYVAETMPLPPLFVALFIQIAVDILVFPVLILRATIIGPKRTFTMLDRWGRRWV